MNDDLQVMLRKADAAYARAKPEEAAGLYAQVAKLEPNNVVATFWHGTILCQIGANKLERREDATSVFNDAEAIFTKLHDLDSVYGDIGIAQIARCEALRQGLCPEKKCERLEGLAQELVRIGGTCAAALNEEGNLLFCMEKYDDALAAYELAVEAEPRFYMAHLNIGALLWEIAPKRNQTECEQMALSAYARCLQARPDCVQALLDKETLHLYRNELDDAHNCYVKAGQYNRAATSRSLRRLGKPKLRELMIDKDGTDLSTRKPIVQLPGQF